MVIESHEHLPLAREQETRKRLPLLKNFTPPLRLLFLVIFPFLRRLRLCLLVARRLPI